MLEREFVTSAVAAFFEVQLLLHLHNGLLQISLRFLQRFPTLDQSPFFLFR